MSSTISPHTIHVGQQMMIDGHSIVVLDRNGEEQLSEVAISEQMKTRAATREDVTEICTVCQDDLYEEGTNKFIATLHCGHEYHENCIKRWVREKNVCPLCNAVAIVPELVL